MLKSVDWLKAHLSDEHISIVDCRFQLQNPDYGQMEFEKGHIPGAVFIDLEKDMSGLVQEHGGRHPLPDMEVFRKRLELAGISSDQTIVAYDNGECTYASRFVWMLHYMGHTDCYCLDGGLSAWLKKGYPIGTEAPAPETGQLNTELQPALLASYDEVKNWSEDRNSNIILVDSRDSRRYAGIEEPIDRIPGHIPGAVNYPFTDGFTDHSFLSSADMKKRFQQLNPEKEIIVYCGSGVTAAPNFIALKHAGYEHVKLYIGSYSDWVSYVENPVEKNED
ncbi:sulfurtransferase [Bacillus sp. 1P06AnD]|uniref:sulfurtransferase n=1 Tax=Bacillus sp. 1P06AnD TaxID=3132208 RepID=UPI0039A1E848